MAYVFSLPFNELNLNDILLGVISAAFGFYLLVILLILKNTKFPVWINRKIGHFLGGTFIAFIVFQFSSLSGIVFAVGLFIILFVIFLICSRGKLLTEYFMFNFRENEKDHTFLINTISTLFVLLGILLFFYNYPAVFVAGALVISWGDTFGEVIGKTLPFVKYRIFCDKSVSGTIGVFIFSFLSFISAIILYEVHFSIKAFWICILGSFTCALIESASWKWFDNIVLPPIGSLFMWWIITI